MKRLTLSTAIAIAPFLWSLAGGYSAVEAMYPQQAPPAKAASKRSGAEEFIDYKLPAGSVFQAQLRTAIGSATNRVGDQVRATLRESIDRNGFELLPVGSVMHGKVITVIPASPRSPRGRIALAFYVIEHPRTRSRASFRTQPIVFDAPDSAPAIQEGSRQSGKTPARDVALTGGEPLAVTLARPLTVRIPK